jgi:putative ABC transport system substrate-binding protein
VNRNVFSVRQLLLGACAALIVLLGTVLASAVSAQDRQRPARVGEIWFQDVAGAKPFHRAFRDGMKSLGYVEGRNVTYFTRFADGNEDRVRAILEELIAIKVDVLFVSQKVVRQANQATKTVPIVCATMSDPVREGIVASLSRPGGNITGLSWQTTDTAGKRLELANELIPGLKNVAIVFDPDYAGAVTELEVVRSTAITLGMTPRAFEVRAGDNLDKALAAIRRDRPQLLIVVDSSVTLQFREPILRSAIRNRIAPISESRAFADSGALLTFGANLGEQMKHGAAYVDKILKGAKPADLPIEQPTKFELVVNLKTAKALGITIPQSILLRADEVIR